VASRTYALYRLKNPRHRFYDLEKGILDQVYSGVEAESVRVKNAVRETAGQFLSRAGHPIKAYYHSRCGGSTETSDSVWKQRFGPGQKIVDCPYCRRNPYHWKASFDLSDLSRALKLPVFQILSIQKTPSGRIAELTVGEPGKEKKITSDEFRSLLGYTRLKSALFEWRIERQDVRFEGIGAGHGVGMCQWGARYLAQQGLNYRQILKYYYPEASLATRSSPLKKLSKSAESG
jgi:stage II sporulation protein D